MEKTTSQSSINIKQFDNADIKIIQLFGMVRDEKRMTNLPKSPTSY